MWEKLKSAIDTVGKSAFFNKKIKWKRANIVLDRFGEDSSSVPNTIDVELSCLINYNYLRSWPITKPTDSGNVDGQSIQVIFLKQDFKDGGFITPGGYPAFNTEKDRFEIDGLIYINAGDSYVSQTDNDDLFIVVVMRREELVTGNKRSDG